MDSILLVYIHKLQIVIKNIVVDYFAFMNYYPHMKMTSSKPEDLLRDILERKKAKNSSYSVSALARDLGVSQSLLSRVMSGKRKLTLAQAQKIVLIIGLSKSDERKLIEATLKQSSESFADDQKLSPKLAVISERESKRREQTLESEKFNAISQWYHLPLLTLISTQGFQNDVRWIARRLGITHQEVAGAIHRLKLLGLIEDQNGLLSAVNHHVEFMPKKSEEAIREHHRQMMMKANEVLVTSTDDQSWNQRDISSLSMGVDTNNVGEAKELIRKFKEDMRALLTKGSANEVYQFNLQLFPISRRIS